MTPSFPTRRSSDLSPFGDVARAQADHMIARGQIARQPPGQIVLIDHSLGKAMPARSDPCHQRFGIDAFDRLLARGLYRRDIDLIGIVDAGLEVDRKSVVEGKGGSVRVDLVGRGLIKKTTQTKL